MRQGLRKREKNMHGGGTVREETLTYLYGTGQPTGKGRETRARIPDGSKGQGETSGRRHSTEDEGTKLKTKED